MTEPDRMIWQRLLAHLQAQHPTLCRQWFKELVPLGVSRGVLRVRAESDVHRDYLQKQCLAAFNEALQAVSGWLIGIRFIGPEEELEPAAAIVEAWNETSDDAISRSDGLVINPDYSFDNFVIGPGNRLAHAAAQAVAANPGKAYNPFFVHGDVGLGKTHLLQAVCLRIRAAQPDAVMYYLSCEGFVTQFMEAVQGGRMSAFRHKFRDVDVLIIDDIHFLTKRDQTQEEFFHTFNSLFQASKQIVLSSDAPPEDIPDLEERLVSRFKWGLVAEVEPPSYETRIEIVRCKALLRGLELPDAVVDFIASRASTNIRELEGALTKVQVHAMVEGGPLDLDLARRALGDRPEHPTAAPSFQTILSVVADFYNIRVADMLSKNRHRSVAFPRQVCMYLARSMTRHSLKEIGLHFGGRDHTTVIHAMKTIDEHKREDPGFGLILEKLEQQIRRRSS